MNNFTLEELKNKDKDIDIDILDNIPYLTFPEDMIPDFYSEIYNFVKNYDGNIFIKNTENKTRMRRYTRNENGRQGIIEGNKKSA